MSDRILVAGIGNIFFGDDGYGVEVSKQLSSRSLPLGVRVSDYGIRGLHLAYELLDPPELLVLVDAVSRGGPPGTLYVMKPDLALSAGGGAHAHGMDLPQVFATVRALGGTIPRVILIGCEPLEVEERIGLSPSVQCAIERSIELVLAVVERELLGIEAAFDSEGGC